MLTSAGGQTTKSYVRGNRSLRRFPFSMPEKDRKEERGKRGAKNNHLGYFRTSLVRANYNDLKNGIHETTEYLELF